MLKKTALFIFALAAMFVLINPTDANAGVAVGVSVGPVYPSPVYPYPYVYAPRGYVGYYPYPRPYVYAPAYVRPWRLYGYYRPYYPGRVVVRGYVGPRPYWGRR